MGGGVGGAGVEQGWRTNDSTRTSKKGPAFKSRRGRHTWVEFVVGSLLGSEGFFPGYSLFLFSSKICSNVHFSDKQRSNVAETSRDIFPKKTKSKGVSTQSINRKFWKFR